VLAQEMARRDLAQQEAERLKGLVERRAISQKEADQAASSLTQTGAAVQIARARVRQAELNLSYTEVNAPIAGITGRAMQSVGSLVAPNADSALLTTLTRGDPIWVRFALSENEFARLRGSEEIQVNVALADGKEYPHAGKLNFAGSTVDAATGTVQMRAELPNPKQELLPGQYVRVRVQAGTQEAFVVPQTAVAQNESGRFVWVADAGKAVPRQVRTGNWLGADWVVLEGLKRGDQVIVDNLVRLRPGVSVVLK
jgi:membrane fusion protein (multidrug efflux system)